MLLEYKVLQDGHIHNDKPLAVGDTVWLQPAVADRYPKTFGRVDPDADKKFRRSTATNEE